MGINNSKEKKCDGCHKMIGEKIFHCGKCHNSFKMEKTKNMFSSRFDIKSFHRGEHSHCCKCKEIYPHSNHYHCGKCDISLFYKDERHCCKCKAKTSWDGFRFAFHCCKCKVVYCTYELKNFKQFTHCYKCCKSYDRKEVNHCAICCNLYYDSMCKCVAEYIKNSNDPYKNAVIGMVIDTNADTEEKHKKISL
jgi:hypothetical protein